MENDLATFTWKSYKDERFTYHAAYKLPGANPDRLFRCTCAVGIKKEACVHSLFAMLYQGMIEIPQAIKATTLDTQRKSGRPRKATRALMPM